MGNVGSLRTAGALVAVHVVGAVGSAPTLRTVWFEFTQACGRVWGGSVGREREVV